MADFFMNSLTSIGLTLICVLITLLPVQAPTKAQFYPAITNESDRRLTHSLVKTTLVALNQANLTGNYTVLRDLGTPSFQQEYKAVQLGEEFEALRQLNLDFGAIVEFTPEFTQVPFIDARGRMHLKGFFAVSEQVQIHFNLVFEATENEWLLSAISTTLSR